MISYTEAPSPTSTVLEGTAETLPAKASHRVNLMRLLGTAAQLHVGAAGEENNQPAVRPRPV